ncbi:GNAT superfamily N-acetyltransferase [Thermocatellispora tengchongensis]|uniref:GNAT superfamily N-acetyltransferase n=1 Tax=Thermocatellispora tengchongensis TaxID=1073253 RepID=A0A840PQS8_9ACTN|nr:GNAT family N-acetyltransferase [Thermocatellispora tengchongensis]MBB5140130.1 GNAT superfamily N-acetyltransferase [Thermocatellispora tengchongensis]
MKWTITDRLDAFPERAEDFLRRDPVLSTVPLTVLARARAGVWPEVLLAWLEDGEEIHGVAVQTTAYPLLLATPSPGSAAALAQALAGREIPGVNGPVAQAEEFAAAWPRPEHDRMAMRLYALGTLTPPSPRPAGTARPAELRDLDLCVAWYRAFLAEAEPSNTDPDPTDQVRARIVAGELVLWEDGGAPVSLACYSTPIVEMSRIGPVYTPPEARRKGYGAAATHAASETAQRAGATRLLLFTDLSNPTSNSIYQALGYRPVMDFAGVHFG